MTRRRSETPEQRNARVERGNAATMRTYSRMERETAEALSTELGRAKAALAAALAWDMEEEIEPLRAEIKRLESLDTHIEQ